MNEFIFKEAWRGREERIRQGDWNRYGGKEEKGKEKLRVDGRMAKRKGGVGCRFGGGGEREQRGLFGG